MDRCKKYGPIGYWPVVSLVVSGLDQQKIGPLLKMGHLIILSSCLQQVCIAAQS
jgi:hypothetical protein